MLKVLKVVKLSKQVVADVGPVEPIRALSRNEVQKVCQALHCIKDALNVLFLNSIHCRLNMSFSCAAVFPKILCHLT